ncbi:thiamine phosphate synthase [Luteipulveratus sp. YIM 133132]|uniref:Thiamine-phosphate synthase n=1 Tax=Luteipulveratus flavus TaxID=3031728 RepID=A0ABT6CCJ1_9MICO|nr:MULTISPECIES: thiamine phosphate synthase [unclassified Luteipulveratus]MDE9366107.1 thiamine phosphate synthase [Luteipulveratus sp. YIM 133132]MDF8265764.1 thiamine phosphate synthase [Luteipulveratus sp. YIM 133296]
MTRTPLDLRLYLVTDTDMCGDHGLVRTVREAVSGGVTVVQLRDPDASDDELVALGMLVRKGLEGTGIPLIVNDRVHLVKQIGADGAHIGQDDLPVPEARSILGSSAYLGLSVHNHEQLMTARENDWDLDYLGVGPVWRTTSKADAEAPIGVSGLKAVASDSPWPCVAIGGVNARRTGGLSASGVAGVAVISAICGQPDPETAAFALRAAWEESP